jgi:hypothetical protein
MIGLSLGRLEGEGLSEILTRGSHGRPEPRVQEGVKRGMTRLILDTHIFLSVINRREFITTLKGSLRYHR